MSRLKCSLCASACARVKLLRGFWARGRVRGDRSVFVTSHRPVHLSRALLFPAWFELFAFPYRSVIFLFAHLPPRWTSMSLDLELAKILDEFAVHEAFRTKLLDSACLKVWQFAEYVDDVKDWTSILSSLEPPIVDRMHIASVRRAYKAACARDAELLSRGRDYPGEDMDAPIESNRRRSLIEEHAAHYRFQLQLSRQPSDTFLAGWTVKKTGARSLLSTWPKSPRWRPRVHIQNTFKLRLAYPSILAPMSHLKPAETLRRWAWHSGF